MCLGASATTVACCTLSAIVYLPLPTNFQLGSQVSPYGEEFVACMLILTPPFSLFTVKCLAFITVDYCKNLPFLNIECLNWTHKFQLCIKVSKVWENASELQMTVVWNVCNNPTEGNLLHFTFKLLLLLMLTISWLQCC